MKKLFYFFVFATLFCVTTRADAAEIINDFHSDIVVNVDGSIDVEEKIIVTAEQNQIKHGIYRDIPTEYQKNDGTTFDVGFSLQKILSDGVDSAHHTESRANGIRIYIGDKNTFVSSGQHIYTIAYKMKNVLGYFEDHDELYWNVTGNGWVFPIMHASARVSLPTTVPIAAVATDGYTGLQGSTETAYQAQKTNESGEYPRMVFDTTRELQPFEGLTIVASWPKKHVVQPVVASVQPPADPEIFKPVPFEVSVIGVSIGFLMMLAYFFIVWHQKGRDPKARTIIAQYEPPKDMSPAVARYLLHRTYDDGVLGAQLIDMASRGLIQLERIEDSKVYTIKKIAYTAKKNYLEDKILLEALFKDADSIEIDGGTSSQTTDKRLLRRVVKIFTEHFKETVDDKLFFKNNKEFLRGAFLLTPLALVVVAVVNELYLSRSAWFGLFAIVSGISYFCISKLFSNKFEKIRLMESTGFMKNVVKLVTKLLTGCAMLMIGIVGYLATTIVIVIIFLGIAGPIHVGFLVALLVVIVVFAKLMPRYSVEGAAYVEHLAGFKLFLNATEKDRLEFHHPPERTPELFQENLGFACALGVEQKWGEQFESVLTSATEIERSGTQRNGFARDMGFVHSFQNFSSAISSASAFPGSRSGSSGGGSSGGGGGGGGGGGW